MISDTIGISNDNLSLLLIKDYQIIIDTLYDYDNLDDTQKKICLLSCLFMLKLYIQYEDAISLISDEHINRIISIVNEHNLPVDKLLIGFYISQYGPKACIDYKHKGTEMRIPTKSDYLFKPIEAIDYSLLKQAMLNSKELSYDTTTHLYLNKNQELIMVLKDILNDVKITRKMQHNN